MEKLDDTYTQENIAFWTPFDERNYTRANDSSCKGIWAAYIWLGICMGCGVGGVSGGAYLTGSSRYGEQFVPQCLARFTE
jgi:hypothetical protein